MPKLKSEASHALGRLNKENRLFKEAVEGDLELVITPATAAAVGMAEAAAFERFVFVELRNAAGELHSWYNELHDGALTFATDHGTNTVAGAGINPLTGVELADADNLMFVRGRAVAKIESADALETWAECTDTVTVGNLTILGGTVTGGTSVQTWAAAPA